MAFESIQSILAENLGIDAEEITLQSTFESLKIDSLDMVELVCSIEDELGVEFGDDEQMSTVEELVAYVDKLKGE